MSVYHLRKLSMWLFDFSITIRRIIINEDNQSSLKFASEEKINPRTKYIGVVKFHFVRKVFRKEDVNFNYCQTDNNIADILTKSLTKIKFTDLSNRNLFNNPEVMHLQRICPI
uniref:Reverse transcriptase Ty1/copia-type domain-containing protein n=1 Tax=Megaselia scalaris TaxID=36166 RepID=T1GUS0_MEGSC